MAEKNKRFSIGKKMYVFVIATVLTAVVGVAAIAFVVNVSQIDRYFKQLAKNSSENFAAFVDVEFLAELRKVAESEEYQALRDKAEEEDDEAAIEEYLKEKGLWEKYCEQRELLVRYLRNMEGIRYLYIIVWGDVNADHDMYLLDDDENPIYETGYYEEREAELMGVDIESNPEPRISNGDWGWLCSAYTSVYDKDGNRVCEIGCDISMDEVMQQRMANLSALIVIGLGFTILILAAAAFVVNKSVVRPLNLLTEEMKKFSPAENKDYEAAGVIDVKIRSNDEIEDIYNEVRTMQVRIVDHINAITSMRRDKEKAEDDLRNRNEAIGKISKEAYKDSLTGIGNKTSYIRKVNELNADIERGNTDFAIVMVDVNCLKMINDHHGHSAGDNYLKGCCRIVCEIYKHSPVYRIGGDEFVVILRGADYEIRQERMKQLREAFDKSFSRTDVEPWERYSASAGMAEYANEDKTVELVFKRADKYMYEEKTRFREKNGIIRG